MCIYFRKEDVTTTMYASIYSDENRSSVTSTFTNKIDEVCQLLLDAMSDQKERYILPIISCYVKSSKSKVDNALLEVKVLRDSGKDSVADSALNFILLLVNVNQLFDVALGLYDFDLVLLVAEKSDKDPKEFLPFLNELKKLPNENYR